MLFNSPEFILVFLPLAFLGFALLRRTPTTEPVVRWLIVVSFVFYAWWDWRLVGLLAGSISVNYLLGWWFSRIRSRLLLGLAVAGNLGLLGWFKYAGFFVETANQVLGMELPAAGIVLPLAISFFTFQQIAYLVDIQRGAAPAPSFSHYCLFVAFFPHLVAGPLLHHAEMLPQFARPEQMRAKWENLAVGLTLFTLGLCKKTVIADGAKAYADSAFNGAASGEPITFVSAWIAATAYAVQIYFDFSGYSDMAIGLARLFGVRLPLNFDSPYRARSITEFWRRWHMTLSRFLRDYLYIPLGGNRHGEGRRTGNLMVVMLLGGLWHGAAWTFVIWGGLHGFFLVVHRLWERSGLRLPGWLAHGLTLMAVIVAWVFFRAESFAAAGNMIAGMAGLNGLILPESFAARFGALTPVLQSLGWRFETPIDAGFYPTSRQMGFVAAALVAALVLPNTQQWLAAAKPALDASSAAPPVLAPPRWRAHPLWAVVLAGLFLVGLGMVYGKPQTFIYFTF